jgi:putative N6-adenine-specific DNA methylase
MPRRKTSTRWLWLRRGRRWFTAEQTIRVDVTAVKSPLRSIDFVTLRIKDAICDRFRRDSGKPPKCRYASA